MSMKIGSDRIDKLNNEYIQKDLKKIKVNVEFNKDFFSIRLTPQELQALVATLQAEAISYDTFYHDLSAGGWARPGVTAKHEKEQIARDGGGADLDDPDLDLVSGEKKPLEVEGEEE